MRLILTIALRNLIRQKRRNLLLGSAIAFGAMILIVASSFSHGITNTLFERIVVYIAGHVGITVSEGGSVDRQICHDGKKVLQIVRDNTPERTSLDESMGVMARAIGNGKSDNVILVGFNVNAEYSAEEARKAEENFKMIVGDFKDLTDSTIENATILAEEKAKFMNVRKGDVLRVRYQDIHGQQQAGRLTVVGIFKPANLFMSAPIFVDIRNLKRLMGYEEYETGQIFIGLKDPVKNARIVADRLHALLKPGLAAIQGPVRSRKASVQAAVLAFKSDTTSLKALQAAIPLVRGASDTGFGRDGAVISATLVRQLSVGLGDTLWARYAGKYETDTSEFRFVVKGIRPDSGLHPDLLLLNEKAFYKAYYNPMAAPADSALRQILPDTGFAAYALLGTEWNLMRRIKTSEELQKLYKDAARSKSKATALSVATMYETASAIIKLEYALNLVTVIMVAVLFFIILIGVINTLRMTIRERTREIGTVRAIGMRKADVRNSFVAEVSLLALFAAMTGTLLGFVAMHLLGLPVIDAGNNPMGMLLVSGRLQFVPTALSVVGFNVLIVFIAALTAWFPSKKAAELHPVEALRHYE